MEQGSRSELILIFAHLFLNVSKRLDVKVFKYRKSLENKNKFSHLPINLHCNLRKLFLSILLEFKLIPALSRFHGSSVLTILTYSKTATGKHVFSLATFNLIELGERKKTH